MSRANVGTITFAKGGIRRVATLERDRTWSIAPPLDGEEGDRVAGALAGVSESYNGPADGAFGPRQLHEAELYLQLLEYRVISVHLTPKKPMPPGTIY